MTGTIAKTLPVDASAASSNTSRIPHVQALDGLRGLAVGAVLLFHFGNHLQGGYLGVDLFFVLSGYLITSLLLAEHKETKSIGLGGFWARRARRLLPALGLFLLAVALYCFFFAASTELVRDRNDALATIFYIANWRAIAIGQDYWALFQSSSPLEHTWSLAIEEQFYVLWPLIILGVVAWRKHLAPMAVFIGSLLVAAASATMMILLYNPANPSRVYFGTDTRAAAILFGTALAAGLIAYGPVRTRVGRIALEVLGLIGVAVLGIAWTRLDGESSLLYQGGFVVVGLAATAVIAAASHPEAGVISRALGWRPIVWLGLISYGVYLWHWLVALVINGDRTGLTGWPLVGLQVFVTLIIALCSYFLLEQPIRRGAISARSWRWLIPLSVFVVLIAIFGATRGATSAIPTRMPGQPDGVLIIGDSVGISLAPGLRNAGLPVTDGAFVGCRLVRGPIATPPNYDDFPDCPIELALPGLLKDKRPKAVVVTTGQWDLYDIRINGRGPWRHPGSPEWNAHFEKRLREVAHAAGKSGAKVFIPTIPFMGPNAIGGTPRAIEGAFDPDLVRKANEVIRRVAQDPTAGFIAPDLNAYLSPKGVYQRSLESVSNMRPDGVHFGPQGSDLVGEWLATIVRATVPGLNQPAGTG